MNTTKTAFAALFMGACALELQATGCELITAVDRSQIPVEDAGCADGQVACGPTAQCPAPGTACLTVDCNGCCSTKPAAAGTACTDHGGKLCDGSGKCVACGQPSDCAAPATACITNTCVSSACGTTNAASGTACSDNVGKVCDGSGKCAACLAATDCPAPTTACKITACDPNAHTCGTTNVAKGSACSDSNGVVCDGLGACVAAHCADGLKDSDETDLDCGGSCGATCKDEAPQQACKVAGDCINGVCSGSPLRCQPPTCGDGVKNGKETDIDCGGPDCGLAKTCAPGKGCAVASDCASAAACSGNNYTAPSTCNGSNICVAASPVDCTANSKVCNVIGCVACNSASDCPATGNECVAKACNANACGTSFLGSSHVMSTGQTAGDCQSLVCNGAGGTTSIDDSADVPPASTTACATAPHCAGSPLTPAYTPAATGTSCVVDGKFPKQVCGNTSILAIAGTCVECNNDSDCLSLNDAGSLTCITSTGTCQ